MYDIIIIGGGTSGCVLANRLSAAHPEFHILVLEAGEDRRTDERVYTPGLAETLRGDEKFDWKFESIPQPGLNGRQIAQPRGKVLGGSSAINSFALLYPNRAGIDVWAELGNEDWGWNDMAKYFRSFQTVRDPSDEVKKDLPVVSPSSKSMTGPIEAIMPLKVHDLQKAWVETFRELGLENTNDPLDGMALGGFTSTCHITGDTHERSHAGTAYLDESTLKRSNLDIITGATVERLIFDGEKSESNQNVATTVVYVKDGSRYEVNVAKEVILAAGAFGSPQILERSGIGNPEILHLHGIDVLQANKDVGEHLQDHNRVGISFEAADDVEPARPADMDKEKKLYRDHREGFWAENACWAFAHMPLLPFLDHQDEADLKRLFDGHVHDVQSKYVREMVLSYNEASATAFLIRKPVTAEPTAIVPLPTTNPVPHKPSYISVIAMLSHPLSRGSTHISSSDVNSKPDIDLKFYDHPLDIEVHARHIQALTKLAEVEPLSRFIRPGGRRLPENLVTDDLEDAKTICREFTATNYHPCGSCRMMPQDDGGVVDTRLRVYGTKNVRIVDASIFPVIPRSNIISVVYAVAERAAQIVSEDWTVIEADD
ncbi:GMC oxidoreductase [Polychaeton citri CBS 116435]|uniref:GMC oxidoreductase n=1 Tax=Polychaeton citri CBS 116435 TaxID=1314669 RepID=A0A9P4QAE6_9PEZI|nr:GMC oxidoreductase [Polychaeton citri CBS 116435]